MGSQRSSFKDAVQVNVKWTLNEEQLSLFSAKRPSINAPKYFKLFYTDCTFEIMTEIK